MSNNSHEKILKALATIDAKNKSLKSKIKSLESKISDLEEDNYSLIQRCTINKDEAHRLAIVMNGVFNLKKLF